MTLVQEQNRAAFAQPEPAKLERLRVEIAELLARAGPGCATREMLQGVTQLIVDYLEVAFARVWTLDVTGQMLELQASAGMYTHLDGVHSRVPVGQYKIGLIARERRPHVTNAVIGDARVHNQAWAKQEGMVAFAGHPLVVGDELLGVLALFSRRELSTQCMDMLGHVAALVAQALARKRAEEARREGEERFRTLADNIPQLAWMADEHGSIFWYNRRWFDYTGTTLEEMEGWGWQKVHHPALVSRIVAKFRRHMETGEVCEDTFPLRGKDGQYRWFLSRALPIRDQNGKVLRWFGTNTDITERRQAEHEQAYLAALVQSSGDAIIGTNRDGIIESWNEGAHRIFGYTAEEAVGQSLSMLVPADQRRDWVQSFARVLGGDIMRSETTRIRKDGALIHVALTGSPVLLDGHVVGICSTASDITERKRAEEELRRTREQLQRHARELEERVAERTASLEQSVKSLEELLYTIAHDLRAPNRAIEGFSQILLVEHADKLDETGRDLLRRMANSALRNDALIRDVLNLGRVSHTHMPLSAIDPGKVVSQVTDDLRGTFQQRGAELVLGKDWPMVIGNELLLSQILYNLISNAIKFGPKLQKPRVEIMATVEGETGVLRIIDNGPGIPPEHQEKIFEPFVRLAGPEEPGTGIGLAIARKAALRMRGNVEVDSAPGKGSCFCVKLPLARR